MIIKILFSILFSFFLIIYPAGINANEITSTSEIEVQASSAPEAKISFTQGFTFPLLQGTSALTEDNNLNLTLTADLSPVSLAGIMEVNITPIAFLTFSGGAQFGSGWNMALGNGIGIVVPEGTQPANPSDPPRTYNIDGSPFDGLIWHAWGAGTFQFDLAAIFPGDWNHLVFQTRQEFRYSHYTKAGTNDFWVYMNDAGENRNGLNYHASYTLGYMMPLSPVLNFVGFMAEMRMPLYESIGPINWGENLGEWELSLLFNFAIGPKLSTILAVQMHTRRNHGFSDFSDSAIYYQDWPIENRGGNRQIYFYRAALILTYTL